MTKKLKKDTMTAEERKGLLEQSLAEMESQKEIRDAAAEKRAAAQEEALTHMRRLKIKKTATFTDAHGKKRKATKTIGTKLIIIEPKLRKKVGAKIWNQITTRVLDRKKLDAFVASGEIDEVTLAECTEEQENAPYIRIT